MASMAKRVVARAVAAVGSTSREEALPLLATNLAVMLSAGGERQEDVVARVVGDDQSIGAKAYRHAARIYGRAQDDWFHRGRSHVGTSVIPAILAAGAEDVVPSLVAGFSAMMTVSAAYGVQAHTSGLRPTSMFGSVGASVAAGVSLGLEAPQIANALSAALVGSGGHSACMLEGADEWRFEVFLAIRAGAEAAWLAANGAVLTRASFEGPSGWCRAHFDDPDCSKLEAVMQEALPISAVSVKPYPASGVAMATIAASIEAGKRFGGSAVERITLFVSQAVVNVPGSLGMAPFNTGIAAGMSLSRCCAEAVLTGTLSASIPHAHRDAIQSLASNVSVVGDSSLDDDTARVDLYGVDGSTLSHTGGAKGMLYPSWGEILQDIEGYAARYEVNPAVFSEMISILSREKVSSEALLGLLLSR